MDNLKINEAKYCSWGDTVHYNNELIFFTKADKRFVYKETQPYLDMQGAYSAVNFGYRNEFITDRMLRQISTLPMLASEYITKEKIELSKIIATSVEKTTGLSGRVHFNVGGAQAVDDALKIISVSKGTKRSFAFEGSYHGRTLGASSITSSFRYRKKYGNFSERANFIPYPYCFRCPYNKHKETCDLFCLKCFTRLFESEYHSIIDIKSGETEYSAFFMELIQGTGGYVIPPSGYFAELAKVLKKYGILVVVDDIQMGMFRTGKLWSYENFEISPDILIFGKSLTNGLNPLSGIWAKEELINPKVFPPGSTHSTFSNNPIGMATAVGVFEWIKQNNYENSVPEKGEYLKTRLLELQKKNPEIGDVDGIGLAVRAEICQQDGFTPNKFFLDKIKDLAITVPVKTKIGEICLLLDIGGYYKNVITLAPPLDITFEEIDAFAEALDQYFKMAKS